jgi:zinc transport system substrate-binding protein
MTTLGCGREEEARQVDSAVAEGPPRLVVYTVNYPLAYFAERIGGDLVEVHFPAPPDEDSAYWSPGPDVIARYQADDLILVNGAGYARWLDRAALPTSKVVDTSAAFADRYIELEGAVTHSHGPEGAHEHAGWAFTTWLDPTLAAEQARAIATAMSAELPEHERAIRERFTILESALLTLDARFTAAAEAIGETPIVFSHPVYQYLERRYGLNGRSVHWEPDRAPDLDELQELRRSHPAGWVVWEARPLIDTRQTLAAIGVESVVFDPCANRPDGGDLMTVMASNAAALEAIAG